tara:strand:- start:42 stop:221 length:180 start_codon:yes stop_codon:yes gene_type:complete
MKDFPRTLQKQAWDRAQSNSRPNAGTPHDWEDWEKERQRITKENWKQLTKLHGLSPVKS